MDAQIRSLCQIAAAVVAGAALMYYLDPQQGRRRRALVRDKAIAVSNDTAEAARGQSRRVANKVQGMVAASRARFGRADEPVDEHTLHERVRACLGRVAEHPGAIQVEVANSVVRLSGDVLARDANPIVKAVERVRGVERVENGMTVHESAQNVPALQGEPAGGNRRWRVPVWSVLAIAAPVAILAATARPSTSRRFDWRQRLPMAQRLSMRRPFASRHPFAEPRRIAERSARRLKDYFNELRTS
jgi:hypothetical protein